MALNKKVALIGLDRQVSGKGTLAATALYGMGLRGGSVLSVAMDQPYEELTIADRFPPAAYRNSFHPAAAFTSRAWPRSLGLLLYGALGSISTTGAADPWTHTITPGATPLYLTLFSRLDTEYHKVRDARIDTLSLTWEKAEPLEISVGVVGTIGTYFTSTWSATNDDSAEQSFYPGDGVFQVETLGTTPATADITGGEITINNHMQPIDLSRSIEPDDNWPGLMEITVTLKLIPTDMNLWQQIITGTGSATAVSAAPIYGSFLTTFTIAAASRVLTLTATRVAFVGEYPEADPAGGPVELTLVGTVVKPAGTAFTATLLNQVASYPGS